MKITGNCLCGNVSFELEADFQAFQLCHCKQCQRATGSAHASNLFTNPDNLRWLKGENRVRRYDVPDRAISSAFCIDCGSGLPYLSRTGKALVVPAGTLDTDPGVVPNGHIFWTERAPWYDAALAAERFDEFRE